MFAFALFGLVFDFASLFTFRYWTDPAEMEEAEAVNMGPLRSSHGRPLCEQRLVTPSCRV